MQESLPSLSDQSAENQCAPNRKYCPPSVIHVVHHMWPRFRRTNSIFALTSALCRTSCYHRSSMSTQFVCNTEHFFEQTTVEQWYSKYKKDHSSQRSQPTAMFPGTLCDVKTSQSKLPKSSAAPAALKSLARCIRTPTGATPATPCRCGRQH